MNVQKLRQTLYPYKKKLVDAYKGADTRTKVNFGLDNTTDRNAWIIAQLQAIPAGKTILDVGAGECQFKPYCAHLKYISQDFNEYDGKGDDAGLQRGTWDGSQIDIVCDILDMPAPAEPYDVVLCTEVLEHVPDPVKVLEKMASVVKPGGEMIVTSPFASLTHFAPYHFCSGFNRYFYEHNLKQLGFEIEEMFVNGDYFVWLAQELHRLPSIMQTYGAKAPSRLEYAGILRTLRLLRRAGKKSDGKSKELLAFGIGVRAKRK